MNVPGLRARPAQHYRYVVVRNQYGYPVPQLVPVYCPGRLRRLVLRLSGRLPRT